jgi:hypothetical protein
VVRFVNWLDSIRFRYLDPTMWFKRNKRLGSRLYENGIQADARIVGIKVTRMSGSEGIGESLRWEFALQVEGGSGESFRAGCRQQLLPHADRIRLGERVKIRYDDRRRVIIDWPATLEGWGLKGDGTEPTGDYKSLDDPPADGIEDERFKDDRKALARGERGNARVLSAQQSQSAFGPVANMDVELRVDLDSGESRDVSLNKLEVPEHGRDLLEPGTVLPVVVDPKRPDRVTIDWAAALSELAGD